jgi:CheY-like chemotaxis protein
MEPKPTILIIDDEDLNIEIMANALKQKYNTVVAHNGHSGLEVAKKTIPSLILLDINMPGIDGYEVCKALKTFEKIKDVPVIFVTVKMEFESLFHSVPIPYIIVDKYTNVIDWNGRADKEFNLHSFVTVDQKRLFTKVEKGSFTRLVSLMQSKEDDKTMQLTMKTIYGNKDYNVKVIENPVRKELFLLAFINVEFTEPNNVDLH